MKYLRNPFTILQISLLFTVSALTAVEENPLSEAQFTEIVNLVTVRNIANSSEHSAQLEEVFTAPNLVSTGRRSRTELKAADDTVIRLGSSTTFSFSADPRSIKLDEGSLLFHSPSGRGGGRIETATATATVIGTTIIVIVAPDGSFKLIVLEGEAIVTFIDGTVRTLSAGQLVFIQASTGNKKPRPSKVMNLDLNRLVSNCGLIEGFKQPLDSYPKIQTSIREQQRRFNGDRKQPPLQKIGPYPNSTDPHGNNREKQRFNPNNSTIDREIPNSNPPPLPPPDLPPPGIPPPITNIPR